MSQRKSKMTADFSKLVPPGWRMVESGPVKRDDLQLMMWKRFFVPVDTGFDYEAEDYTMIIRKKETARVTRKK